MSDTTNAIVSNYFVFIQVGLCVIHRLRVEFWITFVACID